MHARQLLLCNISASKKVWILRLCTVIFNVIYKTLKQFLSQTSRLFLYNIFLSDLIVFYSVLLAFLTYLNPDKQKHREYDRREDTHSQIITHTAGYKTGKCRTARATEVSCESK